MNKQSVKTWFCNNKKDFIDPMTNEINHTKMVEACASELNFNEVGGPLDDETHPIWSWALEA